jgi:hypothetical protein
VFFLSLIKFPAGKSIYADGSIFDSSGKGIYGDGKAFNINGNVFSSSVNTFGNDGNVFSNRVIAFYTKGIRVSFTGKSISFPVFLIDGDAN